ncbi:MAG: c-type cytochrome [Planctomycetales bacterium]|nr:c-type cytochrome [Planctomycetales bacterium]
MRRICVSFVLLGTLSISCHFAYGQRELTEIPEPNPTEELAAMAVAEGMQVNLFASDPDFVKPIHMNWDAQGRLWIASSRNYPQLEPGAKPTDEIVVLEDTDGDGVADQRTVFADDMMIPTAVLPGDGGVYVANSTELIHLRDTDGDGKADQRRTVLSGFGTEDTHHLLHTLRWRPDGRIAMNQSIYIHSHIETPYGVKSLNGGGIWHFDPYTSKLEIFCKGFVNPWGHVITPFGQSLATDGAYFEGINYTFPGAVFVTSPGATRWLSGLNPGSPKHCGLEIISGDAMPPQWQGLLVTNDFRGHRVCLFRVERQGAGFRSVQLPELIRSQHIAFRPIDAKMGPDGALYIADWYNPIIQHGEVDFRDPRRDNEHGRIWRVSAKDLAPLKTPDYSGADEAELAQLLSSSALWERQFARQELAGRDTAAVDQALASATEAKDFSCQLDPLWMQLAQHRLKPDLLDELRSNSDPRVRAAAIRVIAENRSAIDASEEWLLIAAQDEDDQVALEATCGLQQVKNLDSVRALLIIAQRKNLDQYLKFALWNALKDLEPIWSPALAEGMLKVENLEALDALADAASSPQIANLLLEKLKTLAEDEQKRCVQLIANRADGTGLKQLVEWICAKESGRNSRAAKMLVTVREISGSRNIMPAEVSVWYPPLVEQAIDELGTRSEFAIACVDSMSSWKVNFATASVISMLERAISENSPEMVAGLLNAMASSRDNAGRAKIRLLASPANGDYQVRGQAIGVLSTIEPEKAAQELVSLVQSQSGGDVTEQHLKAIREATTQLLVTKNGANTLQRSLASGASKQWPANQVQELVAAVRKSSQANSELLEAIKSAAGIAEMGWSSSPDVVTRLLEKSKTGNPENGERVYRRNALQCTNCHAIGPSGIAIGPNLVSLGASATPDYIVESILNPSAKVKEGFQTLSLLLDDEQLVSGLLQSRTETAIHLLLADGSQRTIPIARVEAIREGKSLMPDGLLDTLSESELVDLIAFLMHLGKDPAFTVDTQNWVRNWRTLQWDAETNRQLNRTSLDTAAMQQTGFEWKHIPSLVNGSIPVADLPVFQPHRENPRIAFLRFAVNCQQGGSIQLSSNVSADVYSIWLDSRPIPTSDRISISAGIHDFVVAIRVDDCGASFRYQLNSTQQDGAVFQFLEPTTGK